LLLARLKSPDAEFSDAALFAVRLIEEAGEKWRAWAADSFHGRYLRSIGFMADLDFCLTLDRFDFVPVKSEGRFVRGR